MSVAALQSSLLSDDVRAIPLTRGMVAIVDADDFERLRKYRWMTNVGPHGNFYAIRYEYHKRRGTGFLMHRDLLGPPPHLMVDHKDGNGLNNTRANLRLATASQNMCNRKRGWSTSGYRGVSKQRSKWVAYITPHGGKQMNLGTFDTAEEAARARDAAARELHGEFASLNFRD